MLKGKRILIVGSGLSGKSVFSYAKKVEAIPTFYSDRLDINLKCFDLAVISPAVSRSSREYIRVKGCGIPIYSELDFAYLASPFRSISVTGTNGKTTTVNMVKGMLESAGVSSELLGNMGIPFTSRKSDDLQICELSSFMLEQSRFYQSDYSCITNITVDHLDYHKTIEKYKKAKLKLISLTKDGIAYNPESYPLPELNKKRLITYSLNRKTDIYIKNGTVFYREKEIDYRLIDIDEIKLKGNNNIENALSAFALCILANGFNLKYADFLRVYKGERYRCEFVDVINGKNVYNDSKGTNVSSVISAYEKMNGTTAILLGGYDKGESYKPLLQRLSEGDIVFISGDNRNEIYKDAIKCNVLANNCKSLEEAIIKALNSKADNILFSPGCSSFDRFSSYAERGKFFYDFIKSVKL